MGTMSSSLTNFLYHYSYFAIFLLSFISSMGIPVGSELAIIGGGALASGEVHMTRSRPSSSTSRWSWSSCSPSSARCSARRPAT